MSPGSGSATATTTTPTTAVSSGTRSSCPRIDDRISSRGQLRGGAMRKVLFVALCAMLTVVWVAGAGASTPSTDVRLTNDCVVPASPDPATPTTAPPGYT